MYWNLETRGILLIKILATWAGVIAVVVLPVMMAINAVTL